MCSVFIEGYFDTFVWTTFTAISDRLFVVILRYLFPEVAAIDVVCDSVTLFVLNSFFGEDPPLLAIFLKKLGYEVTPILHSLLLAV